MALRFGSCKRLALHIWLLAGGGTINYAELPDADVGATVEEFQTNGEDPDRFQALVNARVVAV
jgi:hypothetical protein